MVAYIHKRTVEQKRWLDAETFNAGVALCQMIPGATAMQVAAYVGLSTRGVIGAAASFIGFGLPAFLLMLLFAAVYASTHTLPVVIAAFSGLQVIVVAIVANATLSFGKTTLRNRKHYAIGGVAAVLFGLNANPILVILLAAVEGLAFLQPKPPVPHDVRSSTPMPPTTKPLLFLLTTTALGFLALLVFAPVLFDLAALFFRIDLLAFGGGFASVPLMFHEVVEVRQWLDGPTFLNGIVLGQVTPGPIVITATFVGYLLYGLWGGLLATISIFLPSFMVLVGLAPHFDRLRVSPAFNKIIGGVLCSFVGLLLTVTLRFAGDVQWNLPLGLLAGAALMALLLKVDILWVVVAGTVTSVILFR